MPHLLAMVEEVPHRQQASQEVLEGRAGAELRHGTLDVHHGISKLLQYQRGWGWGEQFSIQYEVGASQVVQA